MQALQRDAKKTNRSVLKDFDKLRAAVTPTRSTRRSSTQAAARSDGTSSATRSSRSTNATRAAALVRRQSARRALADESNSRQLGWTERPPGPRRFPNGLCRDRSRHQARLRRSVCSARIRSTTKGHPTRASVGQRRLGRDLGSLPNASPAVHYVETRERVSTGGAPIQALRDGPGTPDDSTLLDVDSRRTLRTLERPSSTAPASDAPGPGTIQFPDAVLSDAGGSLATCRSIPRLNCDVSCETQRPRALPCCCSEQSG